MDTILIKAVQLTISLSILVIIHECGHFIFAKLFNVRVEKFYLFFNLWFSLFKYKPKNGETEYGIGWLPFGGYVKIAGMLDESMDKETLKQSPQPWEFRVKPAWQRLLIMMGGVLMNFILAYFIYSVIVMTRGEEYVPTSHVKMGFSYNKVFQSIGFQDGDIPISVDNVSLRTENALKVPLRLINAKKVEVLRNKQKMLLQLPANFGQKNLSETFFSEIRFPFVVKTVAAGSPAKAAGLEMNDSITGVNGNNRMDWNEISKLLAGNKKKEITISLYRHGQKLTLPIIPNEFGKIGVTLYTPLEVYETVKKHYNFFTAFPVGIRLGTEQMIAYVSSLKYLFTKEGIQSIGGFGTISNMFPDQWNWTIFWTWTAFFSIILGVMNVLPIPALDGGYILFLLYEIATRRKPNEKFLEYAQITGMILIFGLLFYANWMDIFRTFFK